MNLNIGKNDRALRIGLGILLLGAGFYFKSYWGLLGVIPLATGAIRWCPLYLPLRFSTIKKGETK